MYSGTVKSFWVGLELNWPGAKPRKVQQLRDQLLGLLARELLSNVLWGSFISQELGDLILRHVHAVVRLHLPSNCAPSKLVVKLYSQPDQKGRVILEVNCLTGAITIY